MIEELKDKRSFFQDDEIYLKYFVNRKLNEHEKEKIKEFSDLLDNFVKKVFGSNEESSNYIPFGYLGISYLDDFGYYMVTDADRGYRDVTLFKDAEHLFFDIAYDILYHQWRKYFYKNEQSLKDSFKKEFNLEEFKDFPLDYKSHDYIIDKWDKYFDGNIPQNIIDIYEKDINSLYNFINRYYCNNENNYTFKYNSETKQFEHVEKQKQLKKGE